MNVPATTSGSTPSRYRRIATYDAYVAWVVKLCGKSPGDQAALRSGLGKPVEEVPARMHATLLRRAFVPEADGTPSRQHEIRAYYAVAALVAARPRALRDEPEADPQDVTEAEAGAPVAGTAKPAVSGFHASGTSLGESLALTVDRRKAGDTRVSTAEARLHLVVRQDLDGVHRMLPGLCRQLGSAGVAPDYACLLGDLIGWHHRQSEVTTRWLQAFYRTQRRREADA